MKVIDLGNRATALEPDEAADRIASLDISHLKESGISEAAIDIYRRYRGGLRRGPSTAVERVVSIPFG
jgi:hypothetical protein